jgi:predicted Holliday junction resolvase-like endonuclease
MSVGAALAVGVLLGLLAGLALLRRSAGVRAEGLFRTWQAEEAAELRRGAAEASRLDGKTTVSAGVAGDGALPFLAADAHFVGHPVHLVVFDGDSEVKAGIVDDLRAIVLVHASGLGAAGARGEEQARADAALVAECLAGRRVRWETVRHPAPPA